MSDQNETLPDSLEAHAADVRGLITELELQRTATKMARQDAEKAESDLAAMQGRDDVDQRIVEAVREWQDNAVASLAAGTLCGAGFHWAPKLLRKLDQLREELAPPQPESGKVELSCNGCDHLVKNGDTEGCSCCCDNFANFTPKPVPATVGERLDRLERQIDGAREDRQRISNTVAVLKKHGHGHVGINMEPRDITELEDK